jgi:hypothetical protein
MLNGMLICGRDDVRACRVRSLSVVLRPFDFERNLAVRTEVSFAWLVLQRRTLKDVLRGLLGKLGLVPGRGARRS